MKILLILSASFSFLACMDLTAASNYAPHGAPLKYRRTYTAQNTPPNETSSYETRYEEIPYQAQSQNDEASVPSAATQDSFMIRSEPMQDGMNPPVRMGTATIVEVIDADPSLTTLAKAIKKAGLVETLKEPGPFTIFAPNDMAFAKLSPNAVSDLLSPPNKGKLIELVGFHIVPGKLKSQDLKTMQLRGVSGKPLNLKVNGENAKVNNANIVQKDVTGINGVVHIIDAVLIP
jgi:uncharacterized surface protein with fasciclin (FAS1) repeats